MCSEEHDLHTHTHTFYRYFHMGLKQTTGELGGNVMTLTLSWSFPELRTQRGSKTHKPSLRREV